MINIKLLLAIVVIYCVLFLLFGFICDKIAFFISHKINNVDKKSIPETYQYRISIILFMIINIFSLYYFIKKHKVSILEIYIFGFITWLLFFGMYYIVIIDDLWLILKIKTDHTHSNEKYRIYAYLIYTILMMFLNGAIYAIIAKLAYYYKLAE
jgi:hypothetical protein